MFVDAKAYNGVGIKDWTTSSIENMQAMFSGASNMYAWITDWATENVKDMSHMFSRTDRFSSELNNWEVANVVDMSYMFYSKSCCQATYTPNHC